jgi:hypothetical protein
LLNALQASSILPHFTYMWTRLLQDKSEAVRTGSFLLHLLEKFHCLFMLLSLDMSCKPSISYKCVHWYSPWCQCSQLCYHPWRVPVVNKPECVSRVLGLEIHTSDSPSLAYNPTTAKDPKRIPAKVFLSRGLPRLIQPLHPEKRQAIRSDDSS